MALWRSAVSTPTPPKKQRGAPALRASVGRRSAGMLTRSVDRSVTSGSGTGTTCRAAGRRAGSRVVGGLRLQGCRAPGVTRRRAPPAGRAARGASRFHYPPSANPPASQHCPHPAPPAPAPPATRPAARCRRRRPRSTAACRLHRPPPPSRVRPAGPAAGGGSRRPPRRSPTAACLWGQEGRHGVLSTQHAANSPARKSEAPRALRLLSCRQFMHSPGWLISAHLLPLG